ncbi:effector-associated domain EAD1-containing protein [Thalassiella azotivora]
MELLTAEDRTALHSALLDAYGTKEMLKDLLMGSAGETLDRISTAGDLPGMVADLVGKAAAAPWLPELLAWASRTRPPEHPLSRLRDVVDKRAAIRSVVHPDDPLLSYRVVGQPMADRTRLREALRRLDSGSGSRVLVVDGDPATGKSHTVALISYLRARRLFRLADVNLELLARTETTPISAPVIGRSIALQLGLEGAPVPTEEQETRWVGDYVDWLLGALGSDPTVNWVVVDGFSKVPVTVAATSLIERLGYRAYVNFPTLRLVLLAYDDVDELDPLLPGRIEHERVGRISVEELRLGLLRFFTQEYLEQQASEGDLDPDVDALQARVETSVQRVLEHVHDDDPLRMVRLRRAWRAEVAGAPDASGATPEVSGVGS